MTDPTFAETTDTGAEMFLVFRLNGECFALPVSQVHEVIHDIPRTRVPRASAMAPWLINVRGTVVPLIDVRRRLRMPQRSGDEGRIVVIDLPIDNDTHRIALLADWVEEVIEIDTAMLEPLPEHGAPWPGEFLKGSVRRDRALVFVLETETLFRPEQAA